MLLKLSKKENILISLPMLSTHNPIRSYRYAFHRVNDSSIWCMFTYTFMFFQKRSHHRNSRQKHGSQKWTLSLSYKIRIAKISFVFEKLITHSLVLDVIANFPTRWLSC